MKLDQEALAKAEVERSDLIQECHSLITLIAYQLSCIKLLNLARSHLMMLAQYKANRMRRRQ